MDFTSEHSAAPDSPISGSLPPRLPVTDSMAYYGEPQFLCSHTGNGGMTTSLAMGISGSANERRLARFPLSPLLITGRSALSSIATTPLFDPRDGVETTAATFRSLADEQWTSRSRPVYTRDQINEMLQKPGYT